MLKNTHIFKILLLSSLLLGCTGTVNSEGDGLVDNNDPFEPVNRAVFSFNEAVDKAVLRPVATGYRTVVPEFVRHSVSNLFTTINQPAYLMNALLQGQLKDAGCILGRTGVNLTFGFFGLFDVASEAGIPDPKNDFGQTLAKWGWHSGGPYVMLPLLGPSNVRDALGTGVDLAADPVYWRLRHGGERAIIYGGYALNMIQNREKALDLLDNIKNSSIDYYTTLRTMYQQNRQKKIDQVVPQSQEEVPSYDYDFEIEDEE